MGKSVQSRTENLSQQLTPYAPAAPALESILGNSLNLYNRGVGSGVYDGQRVADFSGSTQAGLGYMRDNARDGLGTAEAGNDYLRGLLTRGGDTPETQRAVRGLLGVGKVRTDGLRDTASALSNPNSLVRTVAGDLARNPTQTQQSLLDVANGKYLEQGGNPYLERQIATSNADALNGVKGAFSASGRFGSGMFSSAAADAVSRNENALRYADYDQERDRQAQAAQAIDATGLARSTAGAQLSLSADQARLQGQQALYDARAGNAERRIGQYGTALQAAQADRAASLAGLGAIPGVQSSLLQPGRTLAGVGAAQDQRAQQSLDARQQVFDESQTNPWRALGLLSGTTLPIATGFGTQTGYGKTTAESNPGFLNSVLGGALGLSGAAANFGTAAPALQSLFSAAGPALMFSDERLKQDVREVGETHDGQPIYSYRFKGSPRTEMGLLAQQVQDEHPEAVSEGPGGALMVDYGKALSDAGADDGVGDAAEAAARKRGTKRPPATERYGDEKSELMDLLAGMIGTAPVDEREAAPSVFSHPSLQSPFVDPEHNALFIMDRQMRGRPSAGSRG